MPSVQGQKARLLLVRGQIRAAAARFWWEGAGRHPVLQRREPIGAGAGQRARGRDGGSESEKNCKQTETLRILGEGSRDGSTDMWMFAISIWCLWDLFSWGRARETEEEEEEKAWTSATDGFFYKLFVSDPTWTSSEGRTRSRNWSQRPFSDHKTQRCSNLSQTLMRVLSIYAQLRGIAHVYVPVTCNHNLRACDLFVKTFVCGHGNQKM